MAMKDIKSITVAPDEEEGSIRLFQSFGWELKSNQEVKTQDVQTFTRQDSDGTEHYQTKMGEHYIKLTFERDPTRKNYTELKTLEVQYYGVDSPVCPKRPTLFSLLWIIVIIVGFIAMIFPGVIILVLKIIFYVNKKKAYDIAHAAYQKNEAAANSKRSEILSKAQLLV